MKQNYIYFVCWYEALVTERFTLKGVGSQLKVQILQDSITLVEVKSTVNFNLKKKIRERKRVLSYCIAVLYNIQSVIF